MESSDSEDDLFLPHKNQISMVKKWKSFKTETSIDGLVTYDHLYNYAKRLRKRNYKQANLYLAEAYKDELALNGGVVGLSNEPFLESRYSKLLKKLTTECKKLAPEKADPCTLADTLTGSASARAINTFGALMGLRVDTLFTFRRSNIGLS